MLEEKIKCFKPKQKTVLWENGRRQGCNRHTRTNGKMYVLSSGTNPLRKQKAKKKKKKRKTKHKQSRRDFFLLPLSLSPTCSSNFPPLAADVRFNSSRITINFQVFVCGLSLSALILSNQYVVRTVLIQTLLTWTSPFQSLLLDAISARFVQKLGLKTTQEAGSWRTWKTSETLFSGDALLLKNPTTILSPSLLFPLAQEGNGVWQLQIAS